MGEVEVWKDIKGYEGLYQVSSLGRVRSLDRYINCNGGKGFKKGIILKPRISYKGYLRVGLSRNRKSKHYLLHRLIASTFLPNPHNLPCVNHKDENKINNVVSNLEWCSYKYNSNYGTNRKRISEKITNNIKLSKAVNQFTKDGVFIKTFPSTKEVERQLGYYHSHISLCCLGKAKTSHGYIWRFA